MTKLWNDLEGASLGRHWLKVCLTSSEDDAWYLTRYDATRDAAVRVMPASSAGAEQQLEMWRRATLIDHPHIVRMLDAGRAEAEGADLIYAVCEYPDDFLAGALAERPLSPTEAREVLNATLSALEWLHDNGLTHGAVDADHVMAFGNRIKLPSDTILPAGEGRSTSDDMRALGMMMHHILTREIPRSDAETDFGYLPAPFRTILQRTVLAEGGDRWTVRDIQRFLNPPPKVEPIRTAPPAPPAEEEHAPAAPVVMAIPEEKAAPVEMKAPPAPAATRPTLPPPRPRAEPPIDRGFPLKWVPVAGLVAAVALGAVILRKPDQHAAANPAAGKPPATAPATPGNAPAKSTPPAAQPATPAKANPAPLVAKNTDKPSPLRDSRDRQIIADARPSTGASIWRVVAYTYNARKHAEKKARSINEKHPALHAEVFSPKGERAPYYVALGGRMTLGEAERVKKEAQSKGMPKDTFVRNFAR